MEPLPAVHLNLLVLERCDVKRNMARYYVLELRPTLFGEVAFVRAWGRIGTKGREISSLHKDGHEAKMSLDRWLRLKQARGYKVTRSVLEQGETYHPCSVSGGDDRRELGQMTPFHCAV